MSFNGLGDDEIERLALLIEECSEVSQIACKILRHGYNSYHPDDDNETPNRRLLEEEVGHLSFVIRMMQKNHDLSHEQIKKSESYKAISVKHYLHEQ